MKTRNLALALIIGVLAGCANERAATRPIQPVAQLELARYAGTWYEIARFDQRFQRGCVGVTAEYGPIDASTVSVKNTCRRDTLDGPITGITGRATRPNAAEPGKLLVRFDRFPLNLFSADYWVIDVQEDYRWAVVSNGAGTTLWILSRTPTMNSAIYDELVARLKTRGLKTEYLVKTRQQ
jgi:apolipoprotein D and lipocalin family protein